jgi:sec-independent protein translocase protein TatC
MRRLDDSAASADEEAKPFLDHLEELRGTLLACVGTLVAAMVACAIFTPQILDVLEAPLAKIGKDPETFLISFRVAGPFAVLMRVAAWSGLLVSAPFMTYFIARFVFPGLTEKEKRVLTRASGFAVVLFALGVCLGYFYCIPIALQMMLTLHDWMGVVAQWTINDYVSFTVQLLLGFGLAFQLPVVVLILGKLGVVTQMQLRKQRKFVIVGCLVLGMMLTPQDVASQMIMAIPLYVLFEMCIWILWVDERRAAGANEE